MSLLDLIGLQRIFHNGAEVFRRKKLNFLGGTVADNPANDSTDITLGEGGGGITGPDATVPGNLATWANEDGTELDDSGTALDDLATKAYVDDAIGDLPEGAGDVMGPADSLVGEIARFAATDGKSIKRSLPKVHDDGRIIAVTDPTDPQDVDTKAARDAAIALAATGWIRVVDTNFTQQTPGALVNGPRTWDGVTWTIESMASAASAVIGASGVVITHNAISSARYPGSPGAPNAPVLKVNLATIAPNFMLGVSELRLWVQGGSNGNANHEVFRLAVEQDPWAGGAMCAWAWQVGAYDSQSPHAGGVITLDDASVPNQLRGDVDMTSAVGINPATACFGIWMGDIGQLNFHYGTTAAADSADNDVAMTFARMRLGATVRPTTPDTSAGGVVASGTAKGWGRLRNAYLSSVPGAFKGITGADQLCVSLASASNNTAAHLVTTIKRVVIEVKY